MYVPPLQPNSNFHTFVSGDVKIDPGAAIANGVILQADPDSRIVIRAGVCIGMGTIIHAHGGTLELEAGANLGAGVLLVGNGKIGANACIGSASTILDSSVASGQVLASGSLVGNSGRPISPNQEQTSPQDLATATNTENTSTISEPPETTITTENLPSSDSNDATPTAVEAEPKPTQAQIYGQTQLNRILLTLFPHSNSLNGSSQSNDLKTNDS